MVTYSVNDPSLKADDFDGFFVGWPKRPSSTQALRALKNSYVYVVARDDSEGVRGRMVGFVSAVSDCVLCAYIPLLEVLPEYQRRGIGTELMRKVLAELRGLYVTDLTCDPDLQPFYERLGMTPAIAMTLRRPEALSRGPAQEEIGS